MPNTSEFKEMCHRFKSGEGAECPICLQLVKDNGLVMCGVADIVVDYETKCPHSFCEDCVTGLRGQASRMCPMCRQDITMLLFGEKNEEDDSDDARTARNQVGGMELVVMMTYFYPTTSRIRQIDSEEFTNERSGSLRSALLTGVRAMLQRLYLVEDDAMTSPTQLYDTRLEMCALRFILLMTRENAEVDVARLIRQRELFIPYAMRSEQAMSADQS